MVHDSVCAAVQDAAGGRPASADSPQMLGGALSREGSAASAELSRSPSAEAEIRRLTEVSS